MAKEIRIGLIAENHFPRLGGTEFWNQELGEAASKSTNLHVSIACSSMPEVSKNFPYNYPVYRSRSLSVLTPYFYRSSIRKMIKREKIDLLLGSTLHGGATTAIRMAKEFGIPVMVQSWGSDVQTVPEIGYGACLDVKTREIIESVLSDADIVLAVSRMNAEMIRNLGCDPNKIRIISGGIDIAAIERIPETNIRSPLNIKEKTFVLLTVGRNRPIKRLKLLFEALTILKKGQLDFRCLCVGPKEDLGILVNSMGLNDVIVLTGQIPSKREILDGAKQPFPNLINLYRAANLYVSVSYFESFGFAALDALACGVPVLVTQNQGIRDVISEGETGFVLRDESAQALAEVLTKLIKERITLSARSEAIKASVAALSWENVTRRLYTNCQELL